LEDGCTHSGKQSAGFIGSRTVIFYVKTKIGQEYAFWTLQMEFEDILEKFLFKSDKVLVKHFRTSASSISGMLKTRLEL
jgi:hypothetical protein